MPKMTLLTVLPSLRTNNLKGLAATLTLDLRLLEALPERRRHALDRKPAGDRQRPARLRSRLRHHGPPARRPRRDVRLIGDHPHVIIAPTDHRLAHKSRLELSDLAHETFLMREPGSGTRGLMEQLFENARVRPKIGMTMSSNETIKPPCSNGSDLIHRRMRSCLE